jgi:hypothetical protein
MKNKTMTIRPKCNEFDAVAELFSDAAAVENMDGKPSRNNWAVAALKERAFEVLGITESEWMAGNGLD